MKRMQVQFRRPKAKSFAMRRPNCRIELGCSPIAEKNLTLSGKEVGFQVAILTSPSMEDRKLDRDLWRPDGMGTGLPQHSTMVTHDPIHHLVSVISIYYVFLLLQIC